MVRGGQRQHGSIAMLLHSIQVALHLQVQVPRRKDSGQFSHIIAWARARERDQSIGMSGQQRITGCALSLGPSRFHSREQATQIAIASAIFHQQQQGRCRRLHRDLGSHNGL